MLSRPYSPLYANQRLVVPTNDWTQKQSSVFAQHIEPTHRVLEYRCGDGCLLATLSGSRQAGIEPAPHLAAVAAEKGIDVRPTSRAFVGEVFDRILLGSAIDELREPVRELAELLPLLTDEGQLLLSRPMDMAGRLPGHSQQFEILSNLRAHFNQAGYAVDDISVERHSYRSTGFQFRARENASSDTQKTYWMVKPFLALVLVARKAS